MEAAVNGGIRLDCFCRTVSGLGPGKVNPYTRSATTVTEKRRMSPHFRRDTDAETGLQ